MFHSPQRSSGSLMAALNSAFIIGAGPAGLYCAILLKRTFPDMPVTIVDQNPPDATFGFGVVFSGSALDFLKQDDHPTHDLITPHMQTWQDMTLSHRGERIVIDGIGFSAIGRLQLLQILQHRAEELGVDLHYRTAISDLDSIDADLIVGADGLNSLVRRAP